MPALSLEAHRWKPWIAWFICYPAVLMWISFGLFHFYLLFLNASVKHGSISCLFPRGELPISWHFFPLRGKIITRPEALNCQNDLYMWAKGHLSMNQWHLFLQTNKWSVKMWFYNRLEDDKLTLNTQFENCSHICSHCFHTVAPQRPENGQRVTTWQRSHCCCQRFRLYSLRFYRHSISGIWYPDRP